MSLKIEREKRALHISPERCAAGWATEVVQVCLSAMAVSNRINLFSFSGSWKPSMIIRFLGLACIGLQFGLMAVGQESIVSEEHRELVPHRLLSLVHAAEVQQELKLSRQQIVDLEACFGRLDGAWLQSRNLSPAERMSELDRLEAELLTWARSNWTPGQLARLKQLELQALSSRMFLRSDIAKELGLTDDQIDGFATLARTTDSLQRQLQELAAKNQSTSDAEKAATEAMQAEIDAVGSELTVAQRQMLAERVGSLFDLTQLKRIYPMAPEFADDCQWFNASPLTLRSLRGQVVIVHFYAFQCHNCHANFEIYRRWHQQWSDQGVVVIGIQSPETKRERDPEAVRQAAVERQLSFPIVLDLEMKNWTAWANTMWPTVYVIDKRGYIRFWWQGELNWQGATGDQTVEEVVEAVLAEASPVAEPRSAVER